MTQLFQRTNVTLSAPSIESLRRIESICTDFEEAGLGGIESIARCLARSESDQRSALLIELVAIDAEWRRARGETPKAANYRSLLSSDADDRDHAALAAVFDTVEPEPDLDRFRPVSTNYEFERTVGRGGIGIVWRVYDRAGGRPLALKQLQPRYRYHRGARDRFIREAALTGTLQHPGVPPVYDRGELSDATPYFTMKLVEGRTLAAILDDDVAPETALETNIGIFEQVAQTIAYAHEHGVVHRDLKPANVMVGRFGEVQVMDWGLAKRMVNLPDAPGTADVPIGAAINDETPSATPPTQIDTPVDGLLDSDGLTHDGDVVGTPQFMAPEQAAKHWGGVDCRTDVFCLGAMLFQILTERPLHDHGSVAQILDVVAAGKFDSALRRLDASSASRPFRDLCRHCLSADPHDRPSHAGIVADRVTQLIAEASRQRRRVEVLRESEHIRFREQQRRWRIIIGMAAGIATIAIGAALVIGYQTLQLRRSELAKSQAQAKAEHQARTSRAASEFLQSILASPLPERRGADVTLREVIEESLPRLEGKFEHEPAVEGEIRRTLGETYRWLDDLDQAIDQYRIALAAFERAEPVDELEVLLTQDRLAGALRSRGLPDDLDESLRLRTHVLNERIRIEGPIHADVLTAMNNLAWVRIERGEWKPAETLLLRAKDLAEQLDASNYEVAILRTSLAEIQSKRGRFDLAEPEYLAGIEMLRQYELDDSLCNSVTRYAMELERHDRFDDAEIWFEKSIEYRGRFFGIDHPATLSSRRKLTRMWTRRGDHPRVLAMIVDLANAHDRTLGEAAGLTIAVRHQWANTLVELGRRAEAIEVLEETVARARRDRGPDHRYTIEAEQRLAKVADRATKGHQ